MSVRGLLSVSHSTITATPPSLERLLLRHYGAMLSYFGTEAGTRLSRKHVSWYSRGLRGSAEFRDAMNRLDDPSRVVALIEAFYDQVATQQAAGDGGPWAHGAGTDDGGAVPRAVAA